MGIYDGRGARLDSPFRMSMIGSVSGMATLVIRWMAIPTALARRPWTIGTWRASFGFTV